MHNLTREPHASSAAAEDLEFSTVHEHDRVPHPRHVFVFVARVG